MTHFASRNTVRPDYLKQIAEHDQWKNASQVVEGAGISVPDIGVCVPERKDIDYFQPGFGNARNSLVHVSPRHVGREFSRAYNTRQSVKDFMEGDETSASVMSVLYDLYKEHASKHGYSENFKLSGFTSGYLPDRAVAAILPIYEDVGIFMKSKGFEKAICSIAKEYDVSIESAKQYILMHEISHLLGLSGDADGEFALEDLIEKFINGETVNGSKIEGLADKVKDAYMHDSTERHNLLRTLKEIGTIAKKRKGQVYEIYSDRKGSRYEKLAINELIEEAIDAGLYGEATIEEYVADHLEQRVDELKQTEGDPDEPTDDAPDDDEMSFAE